MAFIAFMVMAGVMLLCAPAQATHNPAALELVSAGQTGGNGTFDASLHEATPDGTIQFFSTTERLVPEDTDSEWDVYQRAGGLTTLVSAGEINGNGAFGAFFAEASEDGRHVFFRSQEKLVTADTDNARDIYERTAGQTRLVSAGAINGNGPFDAEQYAVPVWDQNNAVSADGTRAFFWTNEQLTSDDTNTVSDVYERSGGTTRLVSVAETPFTGGFIGLKGVSHDGSRVFMEGDRRLLAEDTDNGLDVYERSGGTTKLVSKGAANGPGFAWYADASRDGSHVIFDSSDQLAPDDTDFDEDIYDRSGGQAMLVSPAPLVPCPDPSPLDGGRASEDGQRVLFPTDERLAPEDTDCAFDLYVRTAGATTLVSVGETAGNGPGWVTGGLLSDDGTRVFFQTYEQLVAEDIDLAIDVYERSGTTTTLISAGGINGNGAFDASLAKVDASGDHAFFFSSEQLAPQDTDGSRDLYEHYGGVTSLVSIGPVGGNNGQPVSLGTYWDHLASDDGTRVFFETTERLVSSDTDNSRDVYMARAGAGGYPRPKGATPIHVPLVPAYLACPGGNRVHGPPLAFGSCAPPVQASGNLTVGTPDANGAAPNSAGYLQLNVLVGAGGPPEDSDVLVDFSISDIRCRAGVSACGAGNTAGGADYTGQLEATVQLRMTDRSNGSAPVDPGTTTDLPLPVVAPCVSTPSASTGGTCSVSTSYDAVLPGAVTEGKRAIWALGQVQVHDGGPDGAVATSAGNSLFAVPGVFVP